MTLNGEFEKVQEGYEIKKGLLIICESWSSTEKTQVHSTRRAHGHVSTYSTLCLYRYLHIHCIYRNVQQSQKSAGHKTRRAPARHMLCTPRVTTHCQGVVWTESCSKHRLTVHYNNSPNTQQRHRTNIQLGFWWPATWSHISQLLCHHNSWDIRLLI